MGQINFSSKLKRGIFFVVTLVVIFAIASLSLGLFVHTENHIKDNLIAVTNEIITDKLRVSDGSIKQKEAEDGHTLGVELRAKDLSAIILDSKGQVLARYGIYRDLEGDEIKIPIVTEPKYKDEEIAEYGLFDTYTVPIKAKEEIFGVMKIVRKNNEIEMIKDTLGLVIVFVFPIAWLFAYYFSSIIVRRITRPLRHLVKHLELVDGISMQTIKDSPTMDYEVRVVTRSLNALIEKLRENLKRERQITENISHEFKTPLTRIVSNMQVGKYREAEKEILELGGNVDALLSLATWDNVKSKTDLSPILLHLIKLIPENLKCETKLSKHIWSLVPLAHAQIIWRNMIDNAIKHNKTNGCINLSSYVKGDQWSIEIANTTKDHVDADKVEQRKYKSTNSKGYGIGMAIVSDMCRMHDLTLNIEYKKNMVKTTISGKIAD